MCRDRWFRLPRDGRTAHAGGYFYADYCSGEIWTIDAKAASPATPVRLLDTALKISSFGEDEVGELYVVDLGTVYHATASAS